MPSTAAIKKWIGTYDNLEAYSTAKARRLAELQEEVNSPRP